MPLDNTLEAFKNSNIVWIREYLWIELQNAMEKKWMNQEELSKIVWKSQSYINQILKWKTWTSKVYINFFVVIWLSDQKIIEIFKKSFKKEKEKLFWKDLDIIPQAEWFNLLEDLWFEEDFIKNIALKVKWQNKDQLKRDLSTIFKLAIEQAKNEK